MEFTLVGSQTPYRLMKNVLLISRSEKRTQRLKINTFFFHLKPMEEVKARILVGYVPFFVTKKLHNDFFWKEILVIL